jgi:hypothetical protein
MRFKGAYVAASNDEEADLRRREKANCDRDHRSGSAKGLKSGKATEAQVNGWRTIPGADEAISGTPSTGANGLWHTADGRVAKAPPIASGASDDRDAHRSCPRRRRPSCVLGRLHDQTPRIPRITGWASNKEAFLNESLKIDPTNKITMVFLAEAMVDGNSDTKPQAIKSLKELLTTPNDPNYEVEQAAAQDDARALLKEWGA